MNHVVILGFCLLGVKFVPQSSRRKLLYIVSQLVGAICINVDVNYLTDDVMKDKERIEAFFKNLCRTDMQLGENILSKDEYAKAQKGKRHFKDETV